MCLTGRVLTGVFRVVLNGLNPSVCGCVQIHRGLQALSMIAEHLTRYKTKKQAASTSQATTVRVPTSLLAMSINYVCMYAYSIYSSSSSSSVPPKGLG